MLIQKIVVAGLYITGCIMIFSGTQSLVDNLEAVAVKQILIGVLYLSIGMFFWDRLLGSKK